MYRNNNAIIITGAMYIEDVLDSQNYICVPKLSGSKGDQDHSDEQQPPEVCMK
jgi:hypothetical protein